MLPSGFVYQPSKAPVILCPDSWPGSNGNCCARALIPAIAIDTPVLTELLHCICRVYCSAGQGHFISRSAPAGTNSLFAARAGQVVVVRLAEVRHIHPRVGH